MLRSLVGSEMCIRDRVYTGVYGPAVDRWSCGIMLWVMIRATFLFTQATPDCKIFAHYAQFGAIPEHPGTQELPDHFFEILHGLLDIDPASRWDCATVTKHLEMAQNLGCRSTSPQSTEGLPRECTPKSSCTPQDSSDWLDFVELDTPAMQSEQRTTRRTSIKRREPPSLEISRGSSKRECLHRTPRRLLSVG
eukprot:TRINITY_DN2581_c0_g1_i1.p1 TRINITY_DN2581_c0_g1~~TRINITY_DN2581_c0_g1_i1.p1  ORF type:complete len:193 (-),score=27.48 TRINITY_DN2581_c0_g1_i1:696-1274(-)